jgi:hypothetical protein
MKICFISHNGHFGKLPRTFENCRTEFAWQIALNADHFPIQYLFSNSAKEVPLYDIAIVILPKKLETIDTIRLLDLVKVIGKKVTVMQEGPAWYYQDYDYTNQVNYINFLSSMDFLLTHNKSDIPYFKGIFKKPTFNLQSLMIEDTIKDVSRKNNQMPIIGGNFCSWYGGVDSYFVAQNFNKPTFIPSMGRKIENEEQFPSLHHLPYMMWNEWIKTLANFNVGIHLMRTHAAGTFALNCAYLGIPCIGYKGLDTQETLHPELTVNIGDIEKANQLAVRLRDDKEFYNYCSENARDNYKIFYTEEIWYNNFNSMLSSIYEKN